MSGTTITAHLYACQSCMAVRLGPAPNRWAYQAEPLQLRCVGYCYPMPTPTPHVFLGKVEGNGAGMPNVYSEDAGR